MARSTVLVTTANNRKLLMAEDTAARRMFAAQGGIAAQAAGTAHRFTSSKGRKAALKRWRKHPMTARGYRKGARFVRRPPVPRQPFRDKYALEPCRGIQYTPDSKQWVLSDRYGTRIITERTALQRLGHLPKATDRIVPIAVERRVK